MQFNLPVPFPARNTLKLRKFPACSNHFAAQPFPAPATVWPAGITPARISYTRPRCDRLSDRRMRIGRCNPIEPEVQAKEQLHEPRDRDLAHIPRRVAALLQLGGSLARRALLAGVVAAEFGLVYVAVAVNHWNARFFNALEARNWNAFTDELVIFCFITWRAPSPPAWRNISSARPCRSAGGAG